MWAQFLIEAVIGTGAVVGTAYGLARHSSPADPTTTPVSAVGGTRPVPAPVTGAAFERVWGQAEQVGWARLVAAGVLRPVGAPVVDPGNPVGSRLVLVEHITGALGDCRVLLAVNATEHPDGTHDLVAIPVPPDFTDPLAAAAWTYDDPHHPIRTSRASYAALARRT